MLAPTVLGWEWWILLKGIRNGKIILKDKILHNKAVLFNDKIVDLIEDTNLPGDVLWIDAKGNYVSPGFIDIHIHGCNGNDAMDASEEALRSISEKLCESGVTGFLPTTMTMVRNDIHRALLNIRNCMNLNLKGARILGAHMEGPFINPIFKGAQYEKFIIAPEFNIIKDYIDTIRIITLAPERDVNSEFLEIIKEHKHIILSIGHSNATYNEAISAIEKGYKSITHCFNAMTGLHHRNPGIVGAAMNSNVYCELITDTIHVHPAVINVLTKVKVSDRIILVTDSMRAACLKPGTYDLGGQEVIVSSDSARLPDGTLAGSILTMNKAVKNMMINTSCELPEIVKMASFNPAELIGCSSDKGSIEKGKDADLIIFDEDIDVNLTVIDGEVCYFRVKNSSY
jgi:N-acetylglucosamine-6-phosphate deacetylase